VEETLEEWSKFQRKGEIIASKTARPFFAGTFIREAARKAGQSAGGSGVVQVG